jgi:ubiquinone/menaquinone biosynthesis C-methylase UbiE
MMFSEFRTRSLKTERLDRGEFTRNEYVRWRKEMWFIHRLFGETRALRRTLLSDIPKHGDKPISILDVGAGSGTLLSYLRSKLLPDLCLIGLEMSHDSARGIVENGHKAVQGNALSLPFADNSIDYVFCTLVLHHLTDSSAMELIREMRRVTRRKMVVIDLERSVVSYILFKTLGGILLQQFTREDGSLSIKRAYRRDELRDLVKELNEIKVERSAFGRLVVTANG